MRKKSNSVNINNNKTINKYNSKQGQISTCRSVSVFNTEANHNKQNHSKQNHSKNINNNNIHKNSNINIKSMNSDRSNSRNKNIQKFSIQNNQFYANNINNNKLNNEQLKNKTNSLINYKQAIEKRKHKNISDQKINNQSNKNIQTNNLNNTSHKKNYNQQLFITIDKFQQTLCSLPLDKLILSSNPFYWVQEQFKTLQKLLNKFNKIKSTLKEQTYHYYQLKLQSISLIIKNIHQNLQTLTKMTELKDYTSASQSNYTSGGISIQSRNSQSCSTLNNNSLLPLTHQTKLNNQNKTQLNSQINSQINNHKISRYSTQNEDKNRQNKNNQGKNYTTEYQSQQTYSQTNLQNKQNCYNLANKINNRQSQNINRNNKKPFNLIQINQKSHFILHDYKSSGSISQNITQNQDSLQQQDQDEKVQKQIFKITRISKPQQNVYKQNIYDITMDMSRQHFKKKNMNKTVSKYKKYQNEYSQQDKMEQKQQKQQLLNNQQQMLDLNEVNYKQSIQNLITEQSKKTYKEKYQLKKYIQSSIQQGDETKRKNIVTSNISKDSISQRQYTRLTQQLSKIIKQLQLKNRIIIKMQNKHEKQIRFMKEEYNKKQRQYLQTIYQLKNYINQNQSLINSKQDSIKQLLIQREQNHDKYQLTVRQFNQALSNYQLLQSKLNQYQSSIQHLNNQLKLFKLRQSQLRQTVQLQRQRTNKALSQTQSLQIQLNTLQNQLKTTNLSKQTLSKQIQQLNQQISDLNNQKYKMNQKQQVYKIKYFQLYAQFDQFKAKISKDTQYWNKICLNCKQQYSQNNHINNSQKKIELRQLINFHKQRLLKQ